ncbi:MAG TPA: hypothetical protein VLM40_05930 [Gemmata sp.]|nr:hypothetical protein [Gemmata sp.]
MRRKLVLGFGLAGLLAAPANAQFASDRPNSPPAAAPATGNPAAPANSRPLPEGVKPIGGGAYVPPVAGAGVPTLPGTTGGASSPAQPPIDLEIPSALGPNHPWAVKPEDGAYFLCVKSYTRPHRPDAGDNGPSARTLAETLATEIRDLHRVQAFLYEHISDERKAEMAAIAAARERARLFASQLEKYKQEAKLKGMEFLEDPSIRIHYKTVRYSDQIAVLVGGFQSEKDAREALKTLRKWPAPKNPDLMDKAQFVQPGGDGKQTVGGYLNPYLTAYVVPNPTVAKLDRQQPMSTLDPFVKQLNEGRPYNLLKATKSWTLAVRSFSSPVEIIGRNGEGDSVVRKVDASRAKNVLKAGAVQAEKLAEAIRKLKGPGNQPLGLEAFVLHTREGSMVTIGQFDGPNDPALVQTKQLLASMRLNVTEDELGSRPATTTPGIFGSIVAIPIPKE